MSDTYPVGPTAPTNPQPLPPGTPMAAPTFKQTGELAPIGPTKMTAPKEPSIKDRASGLLAAMTDAQRHNAPITPWMLTELAAVVGQVTGNKAVVAQHLITDARGLPTDIIFSVGDTGKIAMVYSAEGALAYVRGLPADVQKRPHWVAADDALVAAVASVPGSDVSPAVRLFEAALAEDRKLDMKPVEIKDKPADDTKKTTDANMEAQRQAALKAQQDRANQMAQQQVPPAPVPAV
jgi:hypothetical protein